MPRGGYRPGAGRPKGQASTEEKRAAKALDKGAVRTKVFKTALDYAMAVINDPEADGDAKVRLAIAAMPFQHPKLEPAAGEGGKRAAKQAAAEKVAGKFGVRSAPKLVVDNK